MKLHFLFLTVFQLYKDCIYYLKIMCILNVFYSRRGEHKCQTINGKVHPFILLFFCSVIALTQAFFGILLVRYMLVLLEQGPQLQLIAGVSRELTMKSAQVSSPVKERIRLLAVQWGFNLPSKILYPSPVQRITNPSQNHYFFTNKSLVWFF